MSTASRCADLSELAGESLGATATTAEHLLLVEVPGTWPRDVSDGEGLPGPAREAIRAWLGRTPGSRALFIRRAAKARGDRQLAFVVDTGETTAEVRRIGLSSSEELAELDLSSAGDVTDAQLVLVCGHGTRDACCVLRGAAVHKALAEHLGQDTLWISSHQGGHRFAANVLVLPAGIQLGRVPADDAPRVVARALADRIELPYYRGRVVYPSWAQAAERAVRESEGLVAIDDLRLLDTDDEGVRFRGPDGREHVAVVEEHAGPVVPASCGVDPEQQRAFTARVV